MGAGDRCFCVGLHLSGVELDLGVHLVPLPIPQVGKPRPVGEGGEGCTSMGWVSGFSRAVFYCILLQSL